ncbi:MAG: hypothetical protein JO364_13990 [Pseudonocardiales bacterium]|nr:hypothetical protein [Pseudonocardiales bacterium]MBV9031381.1 hypothetical protein [Pseudonocardiales bacterium]
MLSIIDATKIAQTESELTSYRLIELRRTGLSGRYALAHLQAFHRYIFGDRYDWVGELRSVSIGKGDLFCLPQHLGSFAEDVFGMPAAVQMDRRHSAVINRHLTEQENHRESLPRPVRRGRHPHSPGWSRNGSGNCLSCLGKPGVGCGCG